MVSGCGFVGVVGLCCFFHLLDLFEGVAAIVLTRSIFAFVGNEFGCLIEVSPASLNKINMSELWLKFDIKESFECPSVLVVKFPNGTRLRWKCSLLLRFP